MVEIAPIGPIRRIGLISTSASSPLKLSEQLAIGGSQIFGDNPGLTDRGHEICVPGPARQDVEMYVIDNARARRVTKVHADVESRRAIYFAERRLGSFRQVHQLVRGFFRGRVQVTHMLVWNYEQVATDVG